ncbi:major capsid protein [Bradyrhizobium sp. AUGA SZCCT0158]|uniref:major capsid protein n=1 Tax=Bradyrhizobium sp. AUGA SZCCT0158 TaxID=2807661 RepID=UPI001BA88785|nr:major capsid protein [Bradyrhizobium sp. AUGA SZCCT0158]MBR1198833.1 major capsid protein [Bradyrhizobium sp. AUGA SZCCT0158]
MVDIYSPAVLNRVVQDLKTTYRPPFLLGRYFNETSVSNQEEIFFDVLTGKPRLAPFCSPLVEGKIVRSQGYATKSFKPAYIKDKRVFEDGKPVRRPAGSPISGPLDAMAVRQINLATESEDQLGMLERRQEWMAAQILRTGTVTVSGEGYPTTVVDFGRDAALSVTLTSTARWNDSAPDPLGNLETWAGLIRDKSGANAVDVVMAQNVWNSFRSNDDVKDLLSRLLNLSERTQVDIGPDAQKLGYTEKGKVGDYNITIYHDQYTDDAGDTQPFLPDDYLMMVGQIEGVRHYGQIKDEKAGFQALDYFQKSWTVEDPAARFLMLQSAPLVVPYRVNACLAAKVQ